MRHDLFPSDPIVTIKRADTILNSSKEARYFLKITVVRMVLSGLSTQQAAHLIGKNVRTVQRWISTADNSGLAALRPAERKGRPPILSRGQKRDLCEELEYHSPSSEGFDEEVWTGKTLSIYLNECFGIKLSPRSCNKLLREYGYRRFNHQGSRTRKRGKDI